MSPVRRRLGYLVAWAVASAVTAGVAWLGIRSVLIAAAPSRMAPLSAAELRNAAPKSPLPIVELTPTPSVSPTPSPSPSPSESPSAKPSPTPSETWQPVPDGKGGTAYRRTFHTQGGDVAVLASRGDVKIESSKPKPGYAVNVNRQAADSVMVSFYASRKASRVWARWTNGPYAEVTEVNGYPT
jgi:hypothetical protein